jgi:hypothetical protein
MDALKDDADELRARKEDSDDDADLAKRKWQKAEQMDGW